MHKKVAFGGLGVFPDKYQIKLIAAKLCVIRLSHELCTPNLRSFSLGKHFTVFYLRPPPMGFFHFGTR